MAGPVPLSPDEEMLWRALTRLIICLPRALDADLARGSGLSLAEYGVLMNLSEAPGRQLRMAALAAAGSLSASRITRLVGDLQQRGLVTRERDPGDARGYLTTLTAAGLSQLQAAWPVHLASARRHVIDRLDPAAIGGLTQALGAIAVQHAAHLPGGRCGREDDRRTVQGEQQRQRADPDGGTAGCR